jgi:epsilon-lactone hydrolase
MSVQMRFLALAVRVLYKPRTSTAERMRARMGSTGEPAAPPQALRERHEVRERVVQGFRCWSVVPRSPSGRGAVYVHGGAYVGPVTAHHWKLVGQLADAGVRVEVPLYGLAPGHTFRDALPLLRQVHGELLEQVGDGGVAVVGDSAGGGLALAHAQAVLGDAALPVRRLVLISPWLDGALRAPDAVAAERRDPWLSVDGLREAARAWSGGAGPDDPAVSPLRGPVSGLPPAAVLIGDRDLLRPDVLRWVEKARAAGVQVELHDEPGAIHVYPLLPVPEGRRGAREVVAAVNAP